MIKLKLRDIHGLVVDRWPGKKVVVRCCGGSKISWARKEVRRIATQVKNPVIIIQSGINNILNTRQDDENITHQVRCMIKEACRWLPKNRVIFTSIIPTDIGGERIATRVRDLNQTLYQVVTGEGATFIDLQSYFTTVSRDGDGNSRLNKHAYRLEGKSHIHLNRIGSTILASVIDAEIYRMESGSTETQASVSLLEDRRQSVFCMERTRYRRSQRGK